MITSNAVCSENSDIGSPKPSVKFNGTHVTTDSYTHEYFLPPFQFEGRNEVYSPNHAVWSSNQINLALGHSHVDKQLERWHTDEIQEPEMDCTRARHGKLGRCRERQLRHISEPVLRRQFRHVVEQAIRVLAYSTLIFFSTYVDN